MVDFQRDVIKTINFVVPVSFLEGLYGFFVALEIQLEIFLSLKWAY